MKIGFVVTMHDSEKYRPYGKKLIDKFIETLYNSSTYPFNLYIIDNQSDNKWVVEDNNWNVWYHYVENQFEEGITGAWNKGINKAVSDGCDIIINSNDDVEFNKTINIFIKIINEHQYKDVGFFGPVSDGMLPNAYPSQLRYEPVKGIEELSGVSWNSILNGFFFGFTKNFYNKFKGEDGSLFIENHPYNGGDGKWAGQEGIQMIWKEGGARLFVIGDCWIKHHKYRDWKKVLNDPDRPDRHQDK